MITKAKFRTAVHDAIRDMGKAGSVAITDTERFQDYGLDSLDTMNLVLEIEARLAINLGDFHVEDADRVDALYEKAVNVLKSQQP